jgi:transposase
VPSIVASVNTHDSVLFPDSLSTLLVTVQRLNVDLRGVPLTLDSGFDGDKNISLITSTGMIPVIKPNFRNTKDKRIIQERTKAFEKVKGIYILRHTIERSFAWEDKYRKLVIRYERLESTFTGFRYLAATMVNYRGEFGKSL